MLFNPDKLFTGIKSIDFRVSKFLSMLKLGIIKESEALFHIQCLHKGISKAKEAKRKIDNKIYQFKSNDINKDVNVTSRKLYSEYVAINKGISSDLSKTENLDLSSEVEAQTLLNNSQAKHITPDRISSMTKIVGIAAFGNFIASANNIRTSIENYAEKTDKVLKKFPDFVEIGSKYIQDNFYSKGKFNEIMTNYRDTLASKMSKAWEDNKGRNWENILSDFKSSLRDTEFKDYQIERIVRTELANASIAANREVCTSSGLDLEVWFTGEEGCDECQAIAADNPYDVDDKEVESLPHPNCRDDWVYKEKEIKEDDLTNDVSILYEEEQ